MRRLLAIRGAIQVAANDPESILSATGRLLTEVGRRNELRGEDYVSIVFTATPDLNAAFPAAAARRLGMDSVALMCAAELDVPGAPPRIVRLLAHVMGEAARHVYLDGAEVLRLDLAETAT
jgi:chorismate mutase